jgi:hypothetical protein
LLYWICFTLPLLEPSPTRTVWHKHWKFQVLEAVPQKARLLAHCERGAESNTWTES